MINAFLKLMEDDSKSIDIKTLFKNKKEQIIEIKINCFIILSFFIFHYHFFDIIKKIDCF